MSPIRPEDPNDMTALLNNYAARLRALERAQATLRLPDSADPLQTFEDGSPLGDTRFLDFGPGVTATLTGDDYVLVSGAGGGETAWDAIVDASLTASDPDNKLFLGIFEAITYCATVAFPSPRANIFVRPGIYTETANLTSAPIDVRLFAPGGLGGGAGVGASSVQWDHAGFTVPTISNWHFYNISMVSGAKSTFFGGDVYAFRCNIDGTALTTPFRLTASDASLFDCDIQAAMNFGDRVWMQACQIRGHLSRTLAGSQLFASATLVGVSATCTWTLPAMTSVEFECASTLRFGTFDSGICTLAGGTAGGTYHIRSYSRRVRFSVSITSTPEEVFLEGNFQTVTTPAQQDPFVLGSKPSRIDVSANSNVDITGPANISLRQNGSEVVTCTLRGRGIYGSVSRWDNGASGAVVDFVNADQCQVDLALDGTSASGTRKPYALDASSANNTLVLGGRQSFPASGTDAGTNNRVLPEGSTPPAGGIAPADADYLVGTANANLSAEIVVGTTPGGELSGTWAAPTVDATHSGSPHGVAIEDEGAAEGQALTVDFTGDGVSVGFAGTEATVTIPGVGTPTAGWGSITNAITDRAYDADATTIDELADTLATLVADLIAQGIIAT